MPTILALRIARLTADRIQSSERQVLILLFCIEIFIFASTFAQMVIAALPDAQTAGAFATLLFSLTMIFNGYVMTFQQPRRHLLTTSVSSNRLRRYQDSGFSCIVSVP